MKKANEAASTGEPRRVGRPRRLTIGQVLDAAIEIGLDQLTMAALAERLGVRVAVLYNYVSGRDELVRVAAQRATARHRFPQDVGQPWREYVTDYARATYELFQSDAQLVPVLVSGDLSPATKIDSAEQWLQTMTARGFTVTEALELLRAVDVVVMGGALLATHAKAVAGGGSYSAAVRAAAANRGSDDLPRISANLDEFAATADPARWGIALNLLLDGVGGRIAARQRSGGGVTK